MAHKAIMTFWTDSRNFKLLALQLPNRADCNMNLSGNGVCLSAPAGKPPDVQR
jgi:hypothetical protein